MKANRCAVARIALSLAMALPPLVWLSQLWGAQYAELWLPLYRAVLSVALRHYTTVFLNISVLNGELVVAGRWLAIDSQIIGGKSIPSGFTVDASTLVGHSIKHALIIFTGVLIWPHLTLRERLQRVAISLPLLILVEALDIPLVFASAIRDIVVSNLAPAQTAASWLIEWTHVMDGGGRIALSLGAVWAAAGLQAIAAQNFEGPRRKSAITDSSKF